jgi:ribosomal protein S18 acetylase RimI-like enzyme
LIKLREATIRDLPLLLEFEKELIEYEREFTPNLKRNSFNYYDLRAYIENPEISVVVAEQHNIVIASGYALINKNKLYKNPEYYVFLGFMYVIAEKRGEGVNNMIMDYLLNWGKSKGYTEFQLDVYAPNISAIKAYEKAGFTFETLTMRFNTGD